MELVSTTSVETEKDEVIKELKKTVEVKIIFSLHFPSIRSRSKK